MNMSSESKKRPYHSKKRAEQAVQTRNRILALARDLFQAEGYELVTIEKIAKAAKVAVPTVYALFQSKRGIVRALLDEALPAERFEAFVTQARAEKSALKHLLITAKIARQIYDAEAMQMDIFRTAAVLAPEFKELELERERRRYHRQEETINTMAQENALAQGLSIPKARAILWAFTGRDMYRMLVLEQKWTSDEYEKWLADLLITTLLNNEAPHFGQNR